jgi:hypothetical protein
LKLTIVVLVLLASLSALSTTVPQNRNQGFYIQQYGNVTGTLILSTGFHRFFRSTLFLLLSGVFFINLATCTAGRIRRTFRSRSFGPDVIHAGVLLLVAGALLSGGREQGVSFISEGEVLELPAGYQVQLQVFSIEAYPDGRPREYVSSVSVFQDGEHIGYERISINEPLKLGRARLYQYSFRMEQTARLRNGDSFILVHKGEKVSAGGRTYVLRGVAPDGGTSLFEVHDNGSFEGIAYAGENDQVGPLMVDQLTSSMQSGFLVVQDRGVVLVFTSFFILAAGFALTFVGRLGEAQS